MQSFKVILLVILLLSSLEYLNAQERKENSFSFIKPFSNIYTDIPNGYSLSYIGSYPIFEDIKSPFVGNIKLGLSSILNLVITNEPSVGDLLANKRPMPSWGVQVQILPQLEHYPSLSLWVNSCFGWNGETINQNDFGNKLDYLINQGLVSFRYEYSTTSAGIATEMKPLNGLRVGLNIGILELRSRNLWIFLDPDPFNGNWINDGKETSSFMFDGGAAISYSPFHNFFVIGEITTLPYFNINMNYKRLAIQHSVVNSLGIRYSLPIPINIDAYLSSNSINGQTVNQFRLGLSGLLNFDSDL